MGKLIETEPPIELTKDEKEHLYDIRNILGKGYIRGYCVKLLHVCPSCHQARGWQNLTICSGCGHKITPDEYRNLDRVEHWEKI